MTHIFEAKELVATVVAHGAGIEQQLLEGRQLRGIRVLLRGRRAGGRAGGSLQGEYQPLCALRGLLARERLTAPDLSLPKKEDI